jgi:mono/diheme cytochrome c family protein
MSRFNVQILLGTIFLFATSVVVLIYGFNEQQRMADFELQQRARAIEQGAVLFEAQCSRCHGTQGTGIPGLCPPLNDRNFFDSRLQEVNWSGTMEDYIVATASSGRLSSTRAQLYPGQGVPAMPSFSEQYGGPLRVDQIRTIAAFIMNWQETAQVVSAPALPTGPLAGTDITKELPEGDPQAGEALATTLGCTACHILAPTGPAWKAAADQPGIGERAAARIADPGYSGQAESPEQYLFEAVVAPNAYLVSGFNVGLMPATYSTQLSEQNLADLIAYMLSLK